MVIRTPRDPSKVNVQFHMSPELLSGEPQGQTGAGAPQRGACGLEGAGGLGAGGGRSGGNRLCTEGRKGLVAGSGWVGSARADLRMCACARV